MAASDLQLKKRNNYKLLSDPELKKGAKKIYRINGKTSEGVSVDLEPEDPRAQKTVLGVAGKTLDLKVPRFKYDKYWIGPPPERDVFIIGLNDSIKGSHLKDLCSSVAPVQSIKFHRHPKTKAFLGAVTVCFAYCGSGKKALEKLDGMIVGGCYLRAELDDQGDHLGRYLEPVLKFLQEKEVKDESAEDYEDSAVRRSSASESGPELCESEGEREPLCSTTSINASSTLSPSLKLYPFSVLNATTPPLTACTAADTKSQLPHNPSDIAKVNLSLPSIESAPPLPPPVEVIAPPPPLPVEPHNVIENISSDEDNGSEQHQSAFILKSQSPLKSSAVPVTSPGDHAIFDPSFGLQTLLKRFSVSGAALSQDCTQSASQNNSISNVSRVLSPHLTSANYELEVEEISGDDSPVMVYKSDLEPLQLETVSDVDSFAGGDDMEVCSDDETTQIELNVKPTIALAINIAQPSTHHVLFPPCLHEDRVYIPLTFSHLQLPSPSMHFMAPPPLSSKVIKDSYENIHSYDLDIQYCSEHHIHSKLEKNVFKNTKEAISLEVLVKALEQLKAVLLNDVQKKLVEASAFSVLDGFWDKERRTQKTGSVVDQQSVKPPEPYRRMLPGLKLGQDITSSESVTSCTPRKRLLNFKIPLVNRIGHRRDQNLSVVTRRRIFNEQEKKSDVQPQESYIASLSDVSSEVELSSAESTDSDYENEDSDYFELPPHHKHLSSTNFSESIENTVDMKLAEENIERIDEVVLDSELCSKLQEASHTVPSIRSTIKPSKIVFKKRSSEEEENIVSDIFKRGLDWEEVQMFRTALSELKHEEKDIVAGVNWSHYPHDSTNVPAKRRRVDHITGCARSEGYYKIDIQEKLKYLPHHQVKRTACPVKQKTTGSGRVNRANQRRLASVYSGGDISNDLAKYDQLKARKKLIKFAKSTIHNWGLFAMENIPADEMVIEYIGEVVRQTVADERERRYEAAGIGSSYLFRVDHDYIIDATRNGNLARFINHCCDPNCYAKVISFGLQKKIIIYSKRDIAMGEEITYDYKFPIEEEKIPCLCGAPNCRGTLN